MKYILIGFILLIILVFIFTPTYNSTPISIDELISSGYRVEEYQGNTKRKCGCKGKCKCYLIRF